MSLATNNVLVQVPQSDWDSVVKALVELNNSVDSLASPVAQHFEVIRNGLLGDNVTVIRDVTKQKEMLNADTTVTTDATRLSSTVNKLSMDELDNIMNEIDNDAKDNTTNDYLSQLSKEEQTFVNQSFSKYPNVRTDLKVALTKSFIACIYITTFNDYYVKELVLSDLVSAKDERYKHLVNIWHDYLAINCNFIHKELKNSLLVLTNKNIQDVEYLYKKWIFCRNMCAYLPIKYHQHPDGLDNWKEYIEMTEYFENKDKNHPLALFCMIYSGIANMMFKWDGNREVCGLDGYFYYHYYRRKNQKRELKENKSIADICLDYFLDHIIQTGIFGCFVSDFRYSDVRGDEKAQELQKRDVAMQKMLKILFNNDKSDLLKLMQYCVQDIKCDSNEHNVVDRYDANTKNKEKSRWAKREAETKLGIVFYVINRLSFVVFHDLMIWKLQKENKSSLSLSMFYPKFIKLYQFLYNFCVWNQCFPQIKEDSDKHEALYIERYYTLRDTVYRNVFDENEVEPKEKDVTQPLLEYFQLYDMSNSDGTILHSVVSYDMRYYTQMLLNDDFPIDIYNRRGKKNRRTALDIANDENSFAIKNIFKTKQEQMKQVLCDSFILIFFYLFVSCKDTHCTLFRFCVCLCLFRCNNIQDESKTDDEPDREQAKNNSVALTNKSIENKYYNYLNQLMSAKYHLMVLGSPVANETCTPDHKLLKIDRPAPMKNVLYDDDLYCNFDAFGGLRGLNKIFKDEKECRLCLNNFVCGMIDLLDKKMAISQDMLIFCWQYCIELQKENPDNPENSELVEKFIHVLNNVTRECLGSKGKNSDKDGPEEMHRVSKLLKSRNYQWFKENLLHSNIWLSEYTDKNSSGSNGNHHVLYENLLTVVNEELIKQKQFIWESFKNEEKNNNEDFQKLLCFGDDLNEELQKEYTISKLRQDKILHGIVPASKELDLILMTVEMEKESKRASATTDPFNIMFENNTKTYLTDCLSYAHVNNARLQKIVKRVFEDRWKKPALVDGKNCRYQPAPVKTHERCVIKATQDYGTRNFPSASCILDFLRFSVTFNTVSDLLVGLNSWVKAIKENKIECFGPNSIIRVKNGFSDVKKWKSFEDANYCDIKLNIIYSNGKKNDKEQQMIIEAQFLVKFLLKAKKMGHKLYSVIRQADYINTICDELYGIDGNYNKYKQKINKMLETNDSSNFRRQLFIRPNCVLSMIRFQFKRFVPLLKIIGKAGNDKLFALFLSCLFHFSLIVMNESNDKNNQFLRKYFNYNKLHGTIGDGREFWGIGAEQIKSIDSMKYKHVELIMSLPYFDGIDQRGKDGVGNELYSLFSDYRYQMLSLLFKYFDKNKLLIKTGLPKVTMDSDLFPGGMVDKNRQCLKLFFDMHDKCGLVVEKKKLNKGIVYLGKSKSILKHDKDASLKKMIQEYIDKHYSNHKK